MLEPEVDGLSQRIFERARVLIVAGIGFGALVAGLGGRLAMFVLRVTSPDAVRGVISDDGFVIGRFTLSGTYNLMLIGSAAGMIGVGVYWLVSPWLIGPVWFRRLTTGLAAAAVVGSMLVHAQGVDFTLLKPTWLAIALFVALPGVFGALIGPAVDWVATSGSWTTRGRRRRLAPVIAIALFPFTALLLAFGLALIAIGEGARPYPRAQTTPAIVSFLVRTFWLSIAVTGLVSLLTDIRQIY